MHQVGRAAMMAALCLGAACADRTQAGATAGAPPAARPAARAANAGDALVAAGFRPVAANTPERQAALSALPPQKFVRQLRSGKVVFLYADPANCGCLYAGGVTAYGTYQAAVRARQAAEEPAMDNFGWSLGPFGYPSGWPDD